MSKHANQQSYPITNQPAQQWNSAEYPGSPPQYSMQAPYQQQMNVIVERPGIQLQVLDGLGKFFIVSTGGTTRTAQDSSNRPLFHYTESIIAAGPNVRMATIVFNDNNGYQFLTVELDLSGIKVLSGTAMLGVMDNLTPCMADWSGSSTLGLGQVSFVGDGTPCCMCCCCGPSKYKFEVSGNEVGHVRSTSKEGTFVEFKPDLDSRAKALLVVGSFMLYNAYWK